MKRVLLAVTIVAMCSASVFAGGSGTTALEVLKFDTGARAIAMGGAFTGVADDINALQWNPGGLTQLSRKEVSITHMSSFMDISMEYIGYVHPLDEDNVVGGAMTIMNYGAMDGYDELGVATAEYTAGDFAPSVSYGRNLGDIALGPLSGLLSVGGTLKMAFQRIEEETAFGIAIDAGALYKLDDTYSLGVVLQNLGPGVKFSDGVTMDRMPLALKAGGAARLKIADMPLLVSADLNMPVGDTINISAGGELIIKQMFAVRGGINSRRIANGMGLFSSISLGMGFLNELTNGMKYCIDYSLVPNGALGFAHRLSLALKI